MVIVSIRLQPLPAKRKELLQTLSSLVEQLRTEAGNLQAGVYQSVEDENKLLLYEEWLTQKDADAHRRSEIFTVLLGVGSLLCYPPEIVFHTAAQLTASGAWVAGVQRQMKCPSDCNPEVNRK